MFISLVLVLDKSAHVPISFIDGTITHLGDYDGCLSMVVPSDDESGKKTQPIHGQYCLAVVRPNTPPKPTRIVKHGQKIFNLTGSVAEGTVFEHLSQFTSALYSLSGYRLGICMPSTCTAYDLEAIANKREF